MGLGFLALAGAAVLGFPVYPRSCAGGWREVGVGQNIPGAKTSPVPKHRRCQSIPGAKASPVP